MENYLDDIRKALQPDLSGKYENKSFRLKQDLAHTGGATASAPISIMPKGTLFRKKAGEGYYSDGFHLILERICEAYPEYFEPVVDGN